MVPRTILRPSCLVGAASGAAPSRTFQYVREGRALRPVGGARRGYPPEGVGTFRRALCVALGLALSAGVIAGEASIEDLMPADAILSLAYYGDNPDLEKTALAQLAAEPEVKEWLGSIRQALAGANALLAQFLKVNPELLKPLLGCRVGLSLVAGERDGEPKPLLVAQVGKAGGAAHDQAKAFLAQVGAVAGGRGEKAVIGGIEFNQFGDGADALLFGLRDEFLLLAVGRGTLERALAPNTPKLAAHPSFRRALAGNGSTVLVLLYDHATVIERFGKEMPPNIRGFFDRMGLSGLRAVGLRLGAKDRALVGSLIAHTAGERRGLLRAIAAPPPDRALLKLAPRDSGFAWLSNVDLGEAYDAFVGALEAALAEEGFREGLAEFQKQAGLNLRDDLLGSLGRDTLVTTSGRSLFPALIISQALKDGDRFEAALGKLIARLNAAIKQEAGEKAGAELRTIRFGDHTIRYLATPGVMLPLAPCYARHGGRIVFALTPIHLKDYLAFLDANEPSVLDHPGFKELEPLVPKDAASLAYSDFAEGVVGLYAALAPFLSLVQAIPGNPVAIDLANPPAARTVRKHMFGAISYLHATDDTLVAETISPLGVSFADPVAGTFVLGLAAGMLLPAFAQARGAAREAAAMNNLRQIAVGITVYANDKGAMPPNLAALVEAKVLADPKVLVAPNDPAPPQVNGLPCSFVYFLDPHPGLKLKPDELDNPARLMIVWQRAPFDDDEVCVAFADGHVETMDEAEFRAARERLDAFLKAKGAKIKGGQL